MRSKGGWLRASLLSGSLLFGGGALALAAAGDISPAAATSPVLDPMAPSSLLAGPSLHETGRVGVMPESSAPPEELKPAATQWGAVQEKSIQPVAAGVANAPPPRPPAGTIDPLLLNREVAANISKVEDCRIEVARNRQVPPAQVSAETLLLRWTIKPTGDVAARDVVATSPTDIDVMTCAKSAMSQWQFSPPDGGSVDMERTVSFKPL
ncbi:MAG TPA: hypothetical protein VMT03_19170 [Polyangia bacterium]|nr:hypothetical protein [Polyangia bacterium]